jgi:hypothetical protein
MKYRTLVISLSFFAAIPVLAADAERYQLKEDTRNFLGFNVTNPEGNAEYVLPFDQPYEQLSAKHQHLLKEFYVEMGEKDEPPYPVGGLKTLYEPITEGQQRLMASGSFNADVEIDAQGNPMALAVYRSPSKAVTRFVSKIVMLTKFKPALCAGAPCKMGFPVRVSFVGR